MLIVQKFGGTSLMDTQRVMAAAQRAVAVTQRGDRVVVVVSAQGHTTDRLVAEAQAVSPTGGAREMDACLAAGE